MKPIDHALQIYETNNADFDAALNWHLSRGVVVSTPDCFMLGFFCNRNEPSNAVEVGKADCVHVTMCVGNMRVACLQIVELVPYVVYQRQFRNDPRLRTTNFRKLFNKLK